MVMDFNCNSPENIGSLHNCMVVLHGHTNYFTGKLLGLPINPRKLQNFSTSDDLQYTVLTYQVTQILFVNYLIKVTENQW